MKRIVLSLAVLAVVWSGVAQATAIFTLGNNPQPNEENVLLNNGEIGATVFGQTNMSGTTVQFSSTTDILTVPSGGQARIEAQDGLIQNITVSVPGRFFEDLILNPLCPPGSGGCGNATVTAVANEPGGGTQDFMFNYSLGNGQNFLTITTSGGETLASVTIDADGFADLRQPRISGVQVVPEPATVALFGFGMAGLLGYNWRRKRTRTV